MFAWIFHNLSTILICAGLLLIVGAIIRSLIRARRAGRSSCGCGCGDCPMGGHCGGGSSAPKKGEKPGEAP